MAYPYTQVPNKIEPFFSKLRQVGVPEQATHNWLTKIGFKSSNDRTLLRVLQFLGFVDAKSEPTELWRGYRSAEAPAVIANAVRRAYADLFDVYPDAPTRSERELLDYMRGSSDAAAGTVARMVSTFMAIAKLADFTAVTTEIAEPRGTERVGGAHRVSPDPRVATPGTPPQQPVSLAIHLHFSADADASLVEKALQPLLPQLATATLNVGSHSRE